MVGPDELLRQPQDEVKQDQDENQARPHPTSISYIFFLCKQREEWWTLTVDTQPAPSDLPWSLLLPSPPQTPPVPFWATHPLT